MGVVVRRHIDFLIIITYSYNYTPIVSSFLQQHPYFFVHFKNVFCSCLCHFCANMVRPG